MRNCWTDRVEILQNVTLVNHDIQRRFHGMSTNIGLFMEYAVKTIEHYCSHKRIQTTILQQYRLEVEEKNGQVVTVGLKKLPWIE